MEDTKKIHFICDGDVPECKKTQCYKSGGECKWTSDIRHAINFENVSEYGTYYEMSYEIGGDVMEDRVPVADVKDWESPATMTDVFQYYMEGLKFSGRAWRRAKIATWIAVFASVTSVATIIALVLILF